MASTNPFLHADAEAFTEHAENADVEPPATGGARKRGAGQRAAAERKKSRGGMRRLREMADHASVESGWPEFEGLKPVLSFLMFPAMLVMAITITGGSWPSAILYPIALILGAVIAVSAFRGVELVLGVLLIYLPFSKVFVVPLAPGINGTNMLILLGLFAAILKAVATRQKLSEWPPGTYLVLLFGFLTSLSIFTIMQMPGGRVYVLYGEILSYKAWIDQFIFYFIVLMCVRDIETAKRCVVYCMIGSVLVVLYSVPEMLEKGGRSTIEKSRIGGPHLQSNNFGGFVAYTLLPVISLFIMHIKDIRAWLITPYFLIAAKVLIVTFSRGAYVAMVVGAMLAGYFKGRGFLALWVAIGLSFILVFPSVIPESIMARMDTIHDETANSSASAEDQLDKSSETRLIMWRAAAKMIEEDPIWGKGFKGFPYVKEDYTEIPVKESDPHSMYLYIGSQMGLPSLALFLVILGYSFWLGRYLSQDKNDKFIRVIGIGGAASTACFAVVCIFGSRAVALNFTVYFWTFLVVMQIIRQKQLEAIAASRPQRKRTNAFEYSRELEDKDLAPPMTASRRNRKKGSQETSSSTDSLKKGWQQERAGKADRRPKRGAAAFQAMSEAESKAMSEGMNRAGNDASAGPVEHTRQDAGETTAAAPSGKKRKRQCASRHDQPAGEVLQPAPANPAMKPRRLKKRFSSF